MRRSISLPRSAFARGGGFLGRSGTDAGVAKSTITSRFRCRDYVRFATQLRLEFRSMLESLPDDSQNLIDPVDGSAVSEASRREDPGEPGRSGSPDRIRYSRLK
jgi:hypothetical protein